MRIKRPILLVLWFLTLSLHLSAGITGEPFRNALPSEQTGHELQKLQNQKESYPSLRQAPDEDGYAQKEVPLMNTDISVVLILGGLIFLYGIMKRKMRKYSFVFLLLISLSGMGQLSAQMTFKANPDNAFVEPGSTDWTPIDVLVNDYYNFGNATDCNKSGLEISIWNGTSFVTSPVTLSLGRARVSADNQIEFRPTAGKQGKEEILYRIHCSASGETSQATVYLNVNDKPDAISDANCYVDPVGIGFNMSLLATNSTLVSPMGDILVGDIDNDNNIEIITSGYIGASVYATRINIFEFNKKSSSLNLKYTISDYPAGHYTYYYAIAKITGGLEANRKNTASLFIAVPTAGEGTLFRYDFSGSGFTETWRTQYMSQGPLIWTNPSVTDLMGDGNQQVIVADKIIDASTGVILATLSNNVGVPLVNQTTGDMNSYSFGRYGHAPYPSSLVPADIDLDGKMEIIGGDCVYEANITNYKGNAGNTYTLLRKVNNSTHPDASDGGVAIADIDLDGYPDVVVSGPNLGIYSNGKQYGSVYIYNPRTGKIMHSNQINNIPRHHTAVGTTYSHGPSRTFVGDVDKDGYPEVCLTGYSTLQVYDLDGGTNLSLKWKLGTSDTSASTTLSMFDFTQDGEARMVYRDITDLRIIRSAASGPVVEAIFNNVGSATGNEYPVVADINGDGHAEIITIGSLSPQTVPDGPWSWDGTLRIYAAQGEKKWAPARPVWNQLSYNPVYVNDDLTIPARPISPATKFYSADGTINRPFNNFLQQSTSLNKEGTMIMLGPDLTFDPRVPKRLKFGSSDDLQVTAGVLNQGDATFNGPISLQLYAYVQSTNTYVKVGPAHSYANTSGLSNEQPNNTVTISYTISGISSALPPVYDNLVMTVNLSSSPGQTPVFSGSAECHGGYNNPISGFSLVNGERVICEGDTETVQLEGAGTYTVKWYTQATGGTSIHTGSSMNVLKNANLRTLYFVECYATSTSPAPITNIRDTVFVYLAPDSLVWTGKGNTTDWHDWQNWSDPSDNYDLRACVPRACTNVQLPAGTSLYPNLNTTETSYSNYSASECNNIHFAHGAELVRPDMLTYDKAFVDVTFNSHRWQLFAPPLKDFYTGDLYINDIIPANDIIKSYTKFWSRRNPWTNYYTSGWTNLFHQPNQSFSAGQALGVWISDKSISGQVAPPRNPFDFSFPKSETSYQVYIEDTTTPDPALPVYPTPRNNHHRFIFDGETPGANFNLTIDGESNTTGQMVLVGNPFMAHLDFDKFYAANSSLIQNYYVILDENAVQRHYNKDVSSTLSKDIAPMQAFLVEIKSPFSNLTANGTMTLSVPGSKLRATEDNSQDELYIKVTASQGELSHETFIKFSGTANDNYIPGEDIAGIFPSKPTSDSRGVILYSQTKDGMNVTMNNMNIAGWNNKKIPLGIWSPRDDNSQGLLLNVSNLNRLPAGYTAYLHDEQEKISYDLSRNSMQYFENIIPDANRFVNARFFLTFVNNGASIEEPLHENSQKISLHQGKLTIEATENIETVQIYNIQGKLLLDKKVKQTSYETHLQENGLYIIKVQFLDRLFVKKLLNAN